MTEQRTGGMLALIPDNAGALALDGGEPASELHLTLLFLGDDVTTWPAGAGDRLRQLVTASAPSLDPVDARIIGPALFNPDGGPDGDRTPCLVLMVSDAPGLDALRTWANWTTSTYDDYPDPPAQHEPYLPHVTVAVDPDSDAVGVSAQTYTGPVRFSTLRLALAGDVLDMPLGNQEAPVITETKSGEITFTPPLVVCEVAALLPGPIATIVAEGKALNARGVEWVAENCGTVGAAWAGDMRDRAGEIQEKRAMSGHELNGLRRTGHTLDGRSNRHPVQNSEDLKGEIDRFHDARPEDKHKLKTHLKSEAHRLYAPQAIHDRIDALDPDHDGDDDSGEPDKPGEKTLEDDVEVKIASPDPRAQKLRNFWAFSRKGRDKWRPGTKGDFKRLRRHLAKYVHTPRVLNGLTANIHKMATGEWSGKYAHTARGNVGRSLNMGRRVGAKALVWPEDVEIKAVMMALDGTDAELAALHAGVDDWGQIFDEPYVADYLAALEEALAAAPAEDVEVDDAGSDDPTTDLLVTAQHATLGARMIADDGAGSEPAEAPEGDMVEGEMAEPSLFDAPVTG
ncbi:MAG TPA: hypothetical protein VE155_07095 [Pseudonocardiaceae bacterium]|nr:hypothetical protein [Pseudonocardiaceae bacterium]